MNPGMPHDSAKKDGLPKQTVHEVIVTGQRYGGALAAEHGIVEEALPEEALLPVRRSLNTYCDFCRSLAQTTWE